MRKFEVGDRVRVNCPGSEVHGEETSIRRLNVHAINDDYGYVGHEVDIVCGRGYPYCIFPPHKLIPIGDDSNRIHDEIAEGRGDWDLLPIRPTEPVSDSTKGKDR